MADGSRDLPFKGEYAKSGRSSCKACETSIAQDSLRLAVMVQSPKFDGKIPNWYHYDCFWDHARVDDAHHIYGFDSLRWDDQQKLKEKIEEVKENEVDDEDEEEEPEVITEDEHFCTEYARSNRSTCRQKKAQVEETEEEKQLHAQNTLFWEYRDQLNTHVTTEEMKSLLESNGQELPSGKSDLLLACSDNMVFGALQKCPECNKGQLVYSSLGYKCTGNVTEWTKCMHISKNPARKAFNVPAKLRGCDFLKKYKYVKRDRVFSSAAASVGLDSTDSAGSSGIKSYGRGLTKDDEERLYTAVPTKLKMNVKGGVTVDPDSGLVDTSHVVEDGKDCIYNIVLGQVDAVQGTNSYYRIQAIESNNKLDWWLFRAWGRNGTTIGGNKKEEFSSRDSAIAAFKKLYEEKTGNHWDDRKNFEKQINKFYPIEIDYGDEDEDTVEKLSMEGSKSKLPKTVQNLIRMIFDVESMKNAMKEFEIDLKKMPLGKLSKRQIEFAYTILTELTNLIEKGGTEPQFLDATNRFYTLVPHDFGLNKPPVLDSEKIIKSKTEMLDNLLEIEVAYNMLKAKASGEDPVDSHYKKLKTDIQPMSKSSQEYKRLVEYVKNTHAATQSQYELEVQEVFKIERDGESKRYSPFKKLHNRQLLWHGSRITNFAGILSQGLRIAPPEAPVTGYMFGKGVYFADMVSKSANYCRTSKSEPVGLLMLCEVALGNMYERYGADYITTLPTEKHSTKGCGRTAPDPAGNYAAKDGVTIPMGKGTDAKVDRSSLLYNEYIVYDVAQINMKYLLQTNFKYKW